MKLTPFPARDPASGHGGVCSTLERAWCTKASSSRNVLYPQFLSEAKSSSLHPWRSPNTRIFALRRTPASRTDVAVRSIAWPRRSAGMWIGLRKEFKLNVTSPASAPRLLNILLRKLSGKVFETFQIFSNTTADYAGFRLWGTAGCQPAVVGSLGQHVRVASPKSRTCCPGGVLLNCQLSGGADTRPEGRPASR